MKIVVIIPTYNERHNIIPLIHSLQEQFIKIPHDMNILVVDDNSPDGTGDCVRAERDHSSNVFLITGKKEGLGAAYIRGMQYAMDTLDADVVMEMDADFSHKPEDVPRLIQAIDEGADFVIGSRYVNGGSIPADWGLVRRMISTGGNLVTRYIAGLFSIKDCTAGFRAIRVSLLKKIDLTDFRVQGYAFQIALLHQARLQGAIIREIPVDFINRKSGETKMSIKDILEFMLHAWWIRFQSSKTFLRFCVVGVSGVIVNVASFTLLIYIGLSKFLASPIAIELSIVSNFFLHNFWTFAHRERTIKLHIRGLKFNAVSFVALVVSYTTFLILSIINPSGIPQIHQVIAILPATLINYALNSNWAFKDSKES
ncbi:MAG: glycosyltransferase family 2 protein [Nitrospirota bacterium]